jgi:hypothetical protein
MENHLYLKVLFPRFKIGTVEVKEGQIIYLCRVFNSSEFGAERDGMMNLQYATMMYRDILFPQSWHHEEEIQRLLDLGWVKRVFN